MFELDGVALYLGEMFALLRAMPSHSFDAVVCDPPYSSGGLMRSDRASKTSDKYVLTGTQQEGHPEFTGDNRDQRAFTFWCTLWMSECLRLVKPGGVLMSFIDWRNGPALADAIQAAGWIWRGRVSWDKTEAARPQKGWFRTGQLEDIMLGTHGPMLQEQLRDGPCLAGLWRGAVNSEPKHHITGKPVEELAENPLPEDRVKLYASNNHMGNFIDCVRSRQTPISDVVSQHRSVSACHLANISLRLGRKLNWDAAKEEFVGDSEANAMLSRPQRAPYTIDA